MTDTQTPITMSVLPPIPMAMHMTLRDYFAAQAMQWIVGNYANARYCDAARHAYLLADAMLKERDET